MKLGLVIGTVAITAGILGCSGAEAPTTPGETGGAVASTGTGGLGAIGGRSGTSLGGTTASSTGGSVVGAATGGAIAATGGAMATGGKSSTGTASSGGTSTGGTSATGGKSSTGGTSATGGKSSTGGTSTGGTSATGGKSSTGGAAATGGTSSCDASWNPPDTANGNTGIPAGLAKEWARTGPSTLLATDTKIHQLMTNGGKMRYCARWDSSSPISYQERQQAAALMRNCDLQWTDKLKGWGCWPYTTIDVKIVMWVVRDASLLTGWTDSEGSYVVGKVSSDEATDIACPAACRQVPGQTQKTSCNGGQVYDEYLWLDGDKADYTGWGWAEGFYMSASYFMSAAKSNATTETIVAHELGHAHSLNDFYNASEVPAGWTHFIMMAGSSNVVTDTDGWMLRDAWRHLRYKWGYPAAQ